MLKNYFKTAWRNLWKNKTYSFLNIFGLAVGIACAGLIFLWVEDELNFDAVNLRKKYLYQVYQNQTSQGKILTINATPGPLAKGLKDEIPGIVNTCRTTWQQTASFTLGEKNIQGNGLYADAMIFSMFTLNFLEGKPDHAFDQLNSIVLTEQMAKRIFGDNKNIVSKTVSINNSEYIVTGIIKDLPENSTLQFDWLSPFQIHYNNNQWLQYWGANGIQTFVELDPQSDVTVLNQKLKDYIHSKDPKVLSVPFLFAMKDWRLRSDFENGKVSGGRIQYVKLFSIIAWVILIIACVNFMNLATARSDKRAKEIGVRKVLGAGRNRLISQFLGEALLLSFLSVLLALTFIYLLLPSFDALVQKHLDMDLNNPVHAMAIISICLACGLIAGSYPSLYLSSFNATSVLKGFKRKVDSAVFTRKTLVVVQFSISIILIISTLVIYQQIRHIKNRPLGYDRNNLIEIGLTDAIKKNFTAIRQDLLATGNIENAGQSMLPILYMGSTTPDFSWQGKNPNDQILLTQDWINPEYIPTTGMHIIKGRNFYPLSKQDSASVIVNKTLADIIDRENAIGKIITRGKRRYTIVGVTSDVIYKDMYGNGSPMIFLTYPENYNYLSVRIKNNTDTKAALAKMNSVIKKYDPDHSSDYQFVDENFNWMFQTEMLTGKLSTIFAMLAIIISCLGLFGLASYTAQQRTKEIGIRKVLGASVTSITSLLSKNFLQLIAISAIVAFPIAWWSMNKWLQGYAYRTHISWWIFVLAGVLAVVIALITISFQSIKAAIGNPVKSLRTE